MGLRIAMVTETYPPEVNGVARTILEMVEGLRRRGHFIHLMRPRQRPGEQGFIDGNLVEWLCRGIAIPHYPQLKMGWARSAGLMRVWSAARPDLVHVATEGPLGWSALAAARRLGIPAATDFHTNFQTYSRHYGVGWLARPVAAYLRAFHNRAACTMVPTGELAASLAAQGFERLRVVGRGVNPVGEDTPVALCVSRFAPEKNFPLVLKAYEAMKAARPDVKLVLVGDGPMGEALRRRNIGCVIAGRLVNGELSAHYASADIFLFASTSETFGNVVIEAMASGLGIVAYRYAAAREHLRHGESAYLAAVDDEQDFIAGARRLALEPALARAYGEAARKDAGSLTWERVVADFEAVLLDVAA
jgi:glycosyltransferase involved in cell wall biosynthesis